MFKRNKEEAPKKDKNGLTCHLLLQEADVRGDSLAVTWVDIEPGTKQQPHRHLPEQVHIIVKGSGKMQVGKKEQTVAEGDVVYVPPNTVHAIENTSTNMLTYVSAATPAHDVRVMYDEASIPAS